MQLRCLSDWAVLKQKLHVLRLSNYKLTETYGTVPDSAPDSPPSWLCKIVHDSGAISKTIHQCVIHIAIIEHHRTFNLSIKIYGNAKFFRIS